MKLVIAGVNHRDTPLDIREKLSITPAELPARLNDLAEYPVVRESVILSTCNRVEAYVILDENAETDSIDSPPTHADPATHFIRTLNPSSDYPITTAEDYDAVLHLLRVTASLDSMVIGETEIISQVAHALELARQRGYAGPILSELFVNAVRTARRIRKETHLGDGLVSIASVALKHTRRILGDLTGRKVLLVGAGAIAVTMARSLKHSGATLYGVSNRTAPRAEELASFDDHARVIEWFDLKSHFSDVDIIVVATAAPHPIFRQHDFQDIRRSDTDPLIVIDLAVPRNVDPEVADLSGLTLMDIDMLEETADAGLAARYSASQQAEKLVASEAIRLFKRLENPTIEPALKRIAAGIQSLADQHARAVLAQLDAPDDHTSVASQRRDILRHTFRKFGNTLTHAARSYLRRLARTGDCTTAVHLAQELFHFDALPPDTDASGNGSGENADDGGDAGEGFA